jgi:hypothetical protein
MEQGTVRQSGYFQATEAGVMPEATTKEGTISTEGAVVRGEETLFKSEVREGDFLYSPLRNEVRKIVAVYSDVRFDIAKPFSTDLPEGEPVEIVRNGRQIEVSISNTGDEVATVSTPEYDNQNFPAGLSVTFYTKSGTTPVVFDPNGGSLSVSIL